MMRTGEADDYVESCDIRLCRPLTYIWECMIAPKVTARIGDVHRHVSMHPPLDYVHHSEGESARSTGEFTGALGNGARSARPEGGDLCFQISIGPHARRCAL